MKRKPVVIFDIDFTVFNNATFRRKLYYQLSSALGYQDFEEFVSIARQTEQATKDKVGYFKPLVFLSFLQKKARHKISLQALKKIFFNESLYIESLYEDAHDVFQEIVIRNDIDIIIFSTGEKEFQMHKVEVLQQMLKEDNVHIFADKLLRLKDILIKYQDNHIYLVDDLPTILYEAKKFDPSLTTVWINRDKHVNEKSFLDQQQLVEGFKADKVISQLTELVPLVTG